MPRGGGGEEHIACTMAGDDLQIDIEVPYYDAVFGGQENFVYGVRRMWHLQYVVVPLSLEPR